MVEFRLLRGIWTCAYRLSYHFQLGYLWLNLILNSCQNDKSSIDRFIKGVYNVKPPKPKYEVTWDPQIVINFLESLYPLSSLSMEKPTLKLITLVALTTAQRAQTFKLLIKNIFEYLLKE
ncbi:hypothetical protein NQ315_017459 [Exocentrus adspersus]|uniref:Uncharacterized protein n=1 Tax=Exocentrus adspersus TaxID=1586481 RepID=A0AAV8VKH4_9CUCU|nr:hypothetical protein NQ315_017459 [Exocentrus adspersus]